MTPDAGFFLSVLHTCSDRCFDLNDCDVHAVKNIVKQMDKWGVKLTPSHYAHALAVWAEKVIVNCVLLDTNATVALLAVANPFLEVSV